MFHHLGKGCIVSKASHSNNFHQWCSRLQDLCILIDTLFFLVVVGFKLRALLLLGSTLALKSHHHTTLLFFALGYFADGGVSIFAQSWP
jgi:hypothetical protein